MKPERRELLLARVERATEVPMLVLAVIFLAVIALPEVVDVSQPTWEILDGVGWLIWGAFAIELLIRIYLAPDRRRYLVSHWIDVLAVAIPFLRPLRVLRVVVVFARFWQQLRRVLRRRTFSLVGATSLLAVAVAATLVYSAERDGEGLIQSFPDALWWGISTITTVGYGDVYPKTAAGRGVAVFLMLMGISLFGVLTARIAAFFVESDEEETEIPKLDEILRRLDRIEQQNLEFQRRLDQIDSGSHVGIEGEPAALHVAGRVPDEREP